MGCALLFLTLGCGNNSSAPPIGNVSGVVTLDSQPLPNATVLFQPETGRPSIGTTDSTGRYTLSYASGIQGAIVGPQKVIIRTEIPAGDGEPVKFPEILPKKYHEKSELRVEIKAGNNKHDFPLSSK